jgi:hypothetical protein
MPDDPECPTARRFLGLAWPWLILLAAVVPAVWHVVDFPEDIDDEFPTVERPTFNLMPPPAYRLAEPGDTIDRISIYFAAGATVLAASGMIRLGRNVTLWPSAFGLAVAGLWHAATPGPSFDGWHGLGFRVAFDPQAPPMVRALVESGAAVLARYWRSSSLAICSRNAMSSENCFGPLASARCSDCSGSRPSSSRPGSSRSLA